MTDVDCVELLQWALPRLALRWPGFRRVRGQVCKRMARRMAELDLSTVAEYRARLESDPTEWKALEACCRITISRFYRDRAVFDHLRKELLPELATLATQTRQTALRAWSAGCASGEEPYTLSIAWALDVAPRFPTLRLQIVATDVSEEVLARAHAGRYGRSVLGDLPEGWLERAFTADDGTWSVRPLVRTAVIFRREDIRERMPEEPFHLILCRNLIFTYFAIPLQQQLLARIAKLLVPGGALVIGAHETLPAQSAGFLRAAERLPIYRLPITAAAAAV